MADWKRTALGVIKSIVNERLTPAQMQMKISQLRAIIESEVNRPEVMREVTEHLRKEYEKALFSQPERNQLGNSYTTANLMGEAQQILNGKISESLELIKLNRERAVETTIQRFVGFASSLPNQISPTTRTINIRVQDGTRIRTKTATEIQREAAKKGIPISRVRKTVSEPIYKVVTKTEKVKRPKQVVSSEKLNKIIQPTADVKYKERRVAIDQGHKLAAAVESAVAEANDAIGFTWRHHHSNNPRPDHVELDDEVFLFKDSQTVRQAMKYGWLNKSVRFTDTLESMPAQEINCRCTASYIYSLSSLRRKKPEWFTAKYEDRK